MVNFRGAIAPAPFRGAWLVWMDLDNSPVLVHADGGQVCTVDADNAGNPLPDAPYFTAASVADVVEARAGRVLRTRSRGRAARRPHPRARRGAEAQAPRPRGAEPAPHRPCPLDHSQRRGARK